jgi:hypothetical protein
MQLKLFDKYNKRFDENCETLKKFYEKAINMKKDDCIKLIGSQSQNSNPVYLLVKTKKWTSIQKIIITKVEIIYQDSNGQMQNKTPDQIIQQANNIFQE